MKVSAKLLIPLESRLSFVAKDSANHEDSPYAEIILQPVSTGFPRFAAISHVHLWRGQVAAPVFRAF